MPQTSFLPPKGFRDLLPQQMAIRNRVTKILQEVFEKYGFEPLQTPTLEYASTLRGKYGAEADRLIYFFTDRGGRELGLNYDLTVPTARVLAAHPDLPKPFKRYQIQSAYRAENPQKSRYRQFTQADLDIIGTTSPLADAEILAVISDILSRLEFNDFTIRLNSRYLLNKLLDDAAIAPELHTSTLVALDKLDKKSPAEVKEELIQKGLTKEQIASLLLRLEALTPQDDGHLAQVITLAEKLGAKNLRFDPFLVRGLDYYTGPIFETVVNEPKIGSLTGGGRYDNLINQLGGPDLPATGTTLGLDRLCDVIEELNLWPNATSSSKVLITLIDPYLQDISLKLATQLRALGIPTFLYPEVTKLEKQLKFADRKNIPYVIIVGTQEAQDDQYTLKDLKTGEQQTLPLPDLISILTKDTT